MLVTILSDHTQKDGQIVRNDVQQNTINVDDDEESRKQRYDNKLQIATTMATTTTLQ